MATFEIEGEDEGIREARILRQLQVSDLIGRLLKALS